MERDWIATRPGGLDVFVFEEYDVHPPQQGEVTIEVRAAGMNPADAKHVARGDAADFPKAIGYEVSGVVSAVGADTEIGSGPVALGDEVLAFRIGTSSKGSFDVVTRFGGVPVTYGGGLEQRVREAAPAGVVAALDCVGTDEAVDVSLALVDDRDRIVTIAAAERARAGGFIAIAGAMPASRAYRDAVRAELVRFAGERRLLVPVARTFPLADALRPPSC